MIADWPGLKPAQLFEDRDLKPTTDLRAVLKGLLRFFNDTAATEIYT